MTQNSVLIVEDDENSAELLATFVQSEGHVALVANSLAEARQQLILHRPAIVLMDLHLPDGSGMDLFNDAELRGQSEIVLITGNASVETSVEALRLGAADYLIKPVSLKLLGKVLQRLFDEHAEDPGEQGSSSRPVNAPLAAAAGPAARAGGVAAEAGTVQSRASDPAPRTGRGAPVLKHDQGFCNLRGTSPAMQEIFMQIERVARTSVSVFIVGQSGTGKELVAESIHLASRRRSGPFEAVNCGAISSQLIESELFGHEKGSFTGAIRQHRGFFERAGGGTLFLDEITEMSLELQVKLLRVLETGTFSRVGSDTLLRSDVRIVAATNRDPFSAIKDGKLREDLFYRLNVFQIQVPALRDRLSDVPLLAGYFLDAYAKKEGRSLKFADDSLRAMARHDWPGNVRELRNFVHRCAIMADGATITAAQLQGFDQMGGAPSAPFADSGPPGDAAHAPEATEGDAGSSANASGREPLTVDSPSTISVGHPVERLGAQGVPHISVPVGTSIADMERELILATLEYSGGAKERTADMLGISLKTLYNRLRSYDA